MIKWKLIDQICDTFILRFNRYNTEYASWKVISSIIWVACNVQLICRYHLTFIIQYTFNEVCPTSDCMLLETLVSNESRMQHCALSIDRSHTFCRRIYLYPFTSACLVKIDTVYFCIFQRWIFPVKNFRWLREAKPSIKFTLVYRLFRSAYSKRDRFGLHTI